MYQFGPVSVNGPILYKIGIPILCLFCTQKMCLFCTLFWYGKCLFSRGQDCCLPSPLSHRYILIWIMDTCMKVHKYFSQYNNICSIKCEFSRGLDNCLPSPSRQKTCPCNEYPLILHFYTV